MEIQLASTTPSPRDGLRSAGSDLQKFYNDAFHRWYNFVLGFSDQLVRHILEKFSVAPGDTVLDPFCGMGTTLIECTKHKVASIGIDANPFSVFATEVKAQFELDPNALLRAAAT